jgi:hypothetical protein
MSADDAELSGTTLSHMIESHGNTPCGQDACMIDAAIEFVNQTKRSAEPWAEVLALHVHASMLDARNTDLIEHRLIERRNFSMWLFDLVERLGGLVFPRSFATIVDLPGMLSIESDGSGGNVLRIVHVAPDKKDVH